MGVLRVGFNAGELSRSARERTDMDMYYRGCEHIRNFVVGQMGGLSKRRGSVLLSCADVPSAGRLFPFVYSVDDTLVLECAVGKLRVLSPGVGVMGVLFSCDAPWKDLHGIRMQQINDVVYFVGAFAPMCLKRFALDCWTFEEIKFDSSPDSSSLLQDDVMEVKWDSPSFSKLRCVGAFKGVRVGDVVRFNRRFSASNKFFQLSPTPHLSQFTVLELASDVLSKRDYGVGAQIGYVNGSTYTYFTTIKFWSPSLMTNGPDPVNYKDYFVSGVSSYPVVCKSSWSFTTDGNWSGRFDLMRFDSRADSFFPSRGKTLASCQSLASARRNYNPSGREDEVCYLACVVFWNDASDARATPNLVVDSFDNREELVVSKVVSDDEVDASGGTYPGGMMWFGFNLSTRDWSLGAFSFRSGYPCSIAFHQDRIWFAGTDSQPQTVWASRVGDYGNFDVERDGADSSLRFTIASSGQNKICWIDALRGIAVGTTDAEWTLSGKDGVIDADSSFFGRQSSVGSCVDVEALTIENGLVYVQRNGKRLRQYAYSLEADGYIAEDLTIFADHVLSPGVVELAYQRSPESVLWAVLSDGSCATMTYNMLQQIKAWGHVDVSGYRIESVCVLPRGDGMADDVVMRVVDGAGVACYAVHGDDAPYLDLAKGGVGVPIVAEFLTNALEGQGSQGGIKGCAVVSASFRNSSTVGLEVTNDGKVWVGPGVGVRVLEGWEDFTASTTWGKSFHVGFRHVANSPFQVDAIKIEYSR